MSGNVRNRVIAGWWKFEDRVRGISMTYVESVRLMSTS